MNSTVKKTVWWSLSIFVFLIIPILVMLSAYDVISIGVSIGALVIIGVVMFFIIAVIYHIKTRIEIKGEEKKEKLNEPISDKESFNIIKDALQEDQYADYIKKTKDTWVAYLGSPKKYPIYILMCELEYNNGITCIGFVNKITKQKSIKFYPKLEYDRGEIEIDIINSANLLSATPGEYKSRTTRRITPDGSELEIIEPIETNENTQKKEEEGVLE